MLYYSVVVDGAEQQTDFNAYGAPFGNAQPLNGAIQTELTGNEIWRVTLDTNGDPIPSTAERIYVTPDAPTDPENFPVTDMAFNSNGDLLVSTNRVLLDPSTFAMPPNPINAHNGEVYALIGGTAHSDYADITGGESSGGVDSFGANNIIGGEYNAGNDKVYGFAVHDNALVAGGSAATAINGLMVAGTADSYDADGAFASGDKGTTGDLEYVCGLKGASPDVAIAKSALPSAGQPGDTITFTIVVENVGTITTTGGITITDAIPTGLTYVSSSPIAAPVGNDYVVATPELAPGDMYTLTIVTTIDASVANGTTITNTATVTTAGDTDPNNNDSGDTVTVGSSDVDTSILVIRKDVYPDDGSVMLPNDTFTFDVSTNIDPSGQVTLVGGQSITFTVPTTGTYTVSEQTPPAGWSLNADFKCYGVAESDVDNVTFTDVDEVKTCVFSNTYTPSEVDTSILVIRKDVYPDDGSVMLPNDIFTFDVSTNIDPSGQVTLVGGQSITFTVPTTGTYTVSEQTPPAGWSLNADFKCYGVAESDVDNVTFTDVDEVKTCVFSNTYTPTEMPDVSIVKTADSATETGGGEVVWTLLIQNTSNVSTTGGITVTDTPAPELAVISIDPAPNSAVGWLLPDLGPGQSTQIVITTVIAAGVDGQMIPNVSTVDTAGDTNPDNNDSTAEVELVLGSIGDTIWNDANSDGVQDTGEAPIPGVTVVLTWPNGATQTAQTDGLGMYLFENLPLDGTYTVMVDTSTLPDTKLAGATGDPENDGDSMSSVTLSEGGTEDDRGRDFGYPPTPEPGIMIAKTPDLQTVMTGDMVTYTIIVTNTGAEDLVNVAVSDPTVPACDMVIGALAMGESTSYQCSTVANGAFVNVATVTGDGATSGTSVSDDDNAAVTTVDPMPDIEIAKTPDLQVVPSGSTFTITVTNTGDEDLVNVAVTDPITPSCDMTIGNLAIGESTSYECALDNLTASVINIANVTGEGADSGTGVSDSDEATATVDDPVLDPGIVIMKTPDLQTVTTGDTVTFTIMVENTGDEDLTNVTVTDAIAPDCDMMIGNLAVGESTSYECSMVAAANVINVADVTGDGVDSGEMVSDSDEASVVTNDLAPELGSIGDMITNADSGDPLPNVIVRLTDANDNVRSTATDASGMYLFIDLPAGQYTVEVDTLSLPAGKEVAPTSDPEGDGDSMSTVDLGEGEDNLDQDFAYPSVAPTETPVPPTAVPPTATPVPPGSIGDTITNSDTGAPLPNVIVRLSQGGTVIDTTATDANGMYLFTGLPAGDYMIEVEPSSLPDGKEMMPASDPENDGDNISSVTLGAGESNLDQDFAYPSVIVPTETPVPTEIMSSIVGQLTHPDGMPVAGATVELLDDMGNVIATTTTNSAGDYSFPDLALGDYTTQVDPDTLPEEKIESELSNPVSITLDSEAPGMGDFVVPLPILGSVDGVVVHDPDRVPNSADDMPLAGVVVQLLDEMGNVVATTVTADDGSYSFPDLPLGTYTTDVVESSLPDDKLPDGQTFPNPPDAVLTADDPNETDQDYGYPTEVLGMVEGMVVHDPDRIPNNEDDMPLGGVVVQLLDSDGNVVDTTITDENGDYAFMDVPLGDYTVDVIETSVPSDKLDQNTFPPIPPVSLTADDPASVDNDAGYPPEPVSLETPVGMVEGTVVHDPDRTPNSGDEQPVGSAIVNLLDTNGDNVATTVTAADGSYSFENVALGTYTTDVDESSIPADKLSEDQTFLDPGLAILTEDNLVASDQDYGYPPEMLGSIGDTITHSDTGNPIPNVLVSLTDAEGNVTYDVTDSEGRYLFEELSAGEYTIVVDPNGLTAAGKDTTPADSPDGDNNSVISLTAGENVVDQDFSYPAPETPLGSISRIIYHDLNANGVQDPGEPGLSGVTLRLYDADDNLLEVVNTGAGGTYIFNDLPVDADYTVEVDQTTLPAGKQGSLNTGDPDGGGDGTSALTLEDDNIDQNFGFQLEVLGSVGNFIYSIEATGNVPLEGVTVYLIEDGTVIDQTTTGADGLYLFDSLPLGEYTVEVDSSTLPGDKAGLETPAYSPDNGDDNTSTFVLTVAEPDNGLQDFAYSKPTAVSLSTATATATSALALLALVSVMGVSTVAVRRKA